MADEKEDVISIGRFSEFKNQSMDWLIEHKKSILYTITIAMMFLFLAYQFFSKFHKKSESDYIQADVSFHRWIASNDSNAEFFDVLKKSIVKHPELHAKYDGLIAEKLLSRKDFEEVKPF
ncbi:MAG TPA: hypothetical protein VLG49_04960, partial [Rhabdochlamydiaceae bacterium]|nr:hypothetical protein [Rhabdochlamydiaceae bacterium]